MRVRCSVERWDLVASTWSEAPSWPRQLLSPAQLFDGHGPPALAGGMMLEGADAMCGSVTAVDLTTLEWRDIAELKVPRYASASVRLADGRWLVVGGLVPDGVSGSLVASDAVEIVDLAA